MSPATSPATYPPISENGLRLLALAGPSALTSFEAERLTARLRAIDPAVTGVDASYLYLITATGELDHERLTELLELTDTPLPDPAIFVAPRIGTQSPWSSKATDILLNTGFTNAQRIERIRVVQIHGVRNVQALFPALHDRMTETVLFGGLDDSLRLGARRWQFLQAR